MPTPDESMLNPMTDILETEEEKQARLEREERIKELIGRLSDRSGIDKLLKKT